MSDANERSSWLLISHVKASVLFGDGVFRLMCREEAARKGHRKVHNHFMLHYYFVSVAEEFRNAYPI